MSRDVAVHREVVVALRVLVWGVTKRALTLCGERINTTKIKKTTGQGFLKIYIHISISHLLFSYTYQIKYHDQFFDVLVWATC